MNTFLAILGIVIAFYLYNKSKTQSAPDYSSLGNPHPSQSIDSNQAPTTTAAQVAAVVRSVPHRTTPKTPRKRPSIARHIVTV
jgi:hypothetical protein